VFTYGQFCSVARGLEVLGERWTLLIVRELLMGSTRFNDLQRGLPSIPRATLSSRLRALESAGIIDRVDDGYRLTEAGAALAPVLREVATWTSAQAKQSLRPEHLDTELLSWDMRRRVDVERLPSKPVVVAFDFEDRRANDRYFWLHLSRTQVDLCRTDTGAGTDLWVKSRLEPITRWWLGQISWPNLLRHHDVRVDGPAPLRRQLPTWFQGYVFAETPAM